MKTVEYNNHAWSVAPRGDGYLLSLAEKQKPGREIHPEHAGRQLFVDATGVYECKRDGSGEVATFGKNNIPALLEAPPNPVLDAMGVLEALKKKRAEEPNADRHQLMDLEIAKQSVEVDFAKKLPKAKSLFERISGGEG